MSKKKPSWSDLTPEQRETLEKYATVHGKDWKEQLMSDWMNGRDAHFQNGHNLRQIRNNFGPTWLNLLPEV